MFNSKSKRMKKLFPKIAAPLFLLFFAFGNFQMIDWVCRSVLVLYTLVLYLVRLLTNMLINTATPMCEYTLPIASLIAEASL